MEPSQQSPLLLPENEHKQLVVIDFEYASANTPGLEFANHFVSTQGATQSDLRGNNLLTSPSPADRMVL